MKAAFYERYGGPELIRVGEMPDPKVAQNSVLVRVRAAALNPADLVLMAGFGDGIMDAWFPVIPGWDVAGIVERVGDGVTEFQPGHEVIAYARQDILHVGTLAELISVPVELLTTKPSALSWTEAAGLPLAGLTAHRALNEGVKLLLGDTLLVLGAAGGVGSLAVQLARMSGARVVGSASSTQQELVRAFGAVPIDYRQDLVTQLAQAAPQGVTVILDCAGRGALSSAAAVLPDARLVSIADAGPKVMSVFARSNTQVLAELADLVATGKLTVPIAATFLLDSAADAMRALASRSHGSGKIVVTMDKSIEWSTRRCPAFSADHDAGSVVADFRSGS